VILSPRLLVRSAFLCSIIVIVTQITRFSSAIVPFSLLPGIYVLGAMVFTPLENAFGWMIYILLGLMGIPVFATPPYGGPGYILKPTFGFVLGYLLLSPLFSWIVQKRKKKSFYYLLFFSFAAVSLPYVPGLIYLWVIMKYVVQAQISFEYALKIGFFPFIGGDFLKAIVGFLIVWKAKPLRGK